ncbi:DUF4136 domain-containing protein [Polaribacter sp. WD7]|uniref:DUF4136 domain-containing protein n=1 Tax=Polaribacter sp. WD7 TaxID=2269061 RepID=UPI000DF3B960|nr:DUF4136 domain-containing protein [Polaribacter sp. WD7]RCS28196.1 DUF4136 domain-containing protein [Polaribacter sp. WD7]
MKNFKYLFFLICLGCSTSKVVVDFEPDTNFTKYKSFEFYEDNGDSLNDFDRKRITAAIEKELKTKEMTTNAQPDFFIYFDAKYSEIQANNTIGIGLGSGGRNGGFGISGGIPIGGKKNNETIIIKFVDASSNNLVWEGSLLSAVKEKRSPQERTSYIDIVVRKILEEYPQKKTSKN